MSPASSDQSTAPRWFSAAVFALALAVFAPSIAGSFVLDDGAQVLQNPVVRTCDVGAIFTRGYWENALGGHAEFLRSADLYRPLTTLSIALSHQIWGEHPFGYHLENTLLHALAALLLFGLLRRWRCAPATALLGAALFAVVPVHIEAVAGIALRGELLAAVFGLLFLRAMAARHPWRAAPWLLAALAAKESAIALPLLAMVAQWIVEGAGAQGWRGWLHRHAPAALGCALYLALRAAVLGRVLLGDDPRGLYFSAEQWPLGAWLTSARFALEHYLPAALAGTPLIFDYSPFSYPAAAPGQPWAWCCAAFWVALALGCAHFAWHRRARWCLGPLIFLLALAPVLNLVTRISILGATRLLYFPYIGIALALALGAEFLWRRLPATRRPLLLGAAALLLGAYATWTEVRLAVWREPLALYEDIVARVPHNTLALGFLAQEEVRRARLQEDPGERRRWFQRAEQHFHTCLELRPGEWPRHIRQIARTAIELGRERELDALLRRIGAQGSSHPFLAHLRAILPGYLRARTLLTQLQDLNRKRAPLSPNERRAQRRMAALFKSELESLRERIRELEEIRDPVLREELRVACAEIIRLWAEEWLAKMRGAERR